MTVEVKVETSIQPFEDPMIKVELPVVVVTKSAEAPKSAKPAKPKKPLSEAAQKRRDAAREAAALASKEKRARQLAVCRSLTTRFTCTCPDFEHRGQYLEVPTCKHIFGIVAQIDDLTPEERGNDFATPTLLDDEGREVPFTAEDKQRDHWSVQGMRDVYLVERDARLP